MTSWSSDRQGRRSRGNQELTAGPITDTSVLRRGTVTTVVGWAHVRLLAVVVLLSLAGALVWAVALSQVRYDQLGDLGLVSVLPTWAYIAFIPLAAALVLVLSRPRISGWLALGITILLIAILYGSSPLLSGEIRISAAWRHLGVVDYVVQHGRVDPLLDVYHNWPGFFVLVAALTQAVGITDIRPIALWAPVWQSLLYLPALYVVFRALTRDRRVVWLAIWIFLASDWIGQDYFSPQGLGFFLYLVMLAVLLRWLGSREYRHALPALTAEPREVRRRTPPLPAVLRRLREQIRADGGVRGWIRAGVWGLRPPRGAGLSPGARAGLGVSVILIFAYVVMAHQLTPFFALAAATALLLLLRVRTVVFVPLMGVLIGAWVIFATVPYLSGHIQQLAEVGDALASNIGGRLSGSPQHQIVVFARLGLTGLLWLGAGVGVLRRISLGSWDATAGALAAAPFPMLGLQSYGGEMLLRIALFSLPCVALLIAFLFLPTARQGRVTSVAIFGFLVLLTSSFMLTRYGNERLETFTSDEVSAIQVVYDTAPRGSLLLAVSGNIPWKWTRYDEYRYRPIGDATYFDDAEGLLDEARHFQGPVYLVITKSQRAYTEMVVGAPVGAFDRFVDGLLATNQFHVVYRNVDAIIAEYIGAGAGA